MADTGESAQRILIIEDEALVARELKSRLTQMGWQVVGIAYGDEAPAIARETHPDLLLTDIHLKGGIDGIQVAREICSEMDIPVVFLTAYSDEETVSRAKAVTPFGYIIKPVENRELQITIDMALYKHRVDKELKETQQLLQTALACIGNLVIFVDETGCITNVNDDASSTLGEITPGTHWQAALGLGHEASGQEAIAAALSEQAVVRLLPFLVQSERASYLVDGVVGPMAAGGVLILRDLARFESENPGSGIDSNIGPRCQLVISTRSGQVDQKVLERTSARLSRQLRTSDLVSTIAGSLISVTLPDTREQEGLHIAKSLLADLDPDYRIGVATSDTAQQPVDLFRQAVRALNHAQSLDQPVALAWQAAMASSPTSEFRIEREYHQVVLLWNAMNIVAGTPDFVGLAEKMIEQLASFLSTSRIAVLAFGDELDLLTAIVNGTRVTSLADVPLVSQDIELANTLRIHGDECVQQGDSFVFDLGLDHVLLLTCRSEVSRDKAEFLKTLVAYYRAGSVRFEEASPPPTGTGEKRLLYQSASVSSVIERARLVSETDATVLITGESGTGKEELARFIHENSARREQPLVIVDCGAVASSVIESELFGHRRGAFTNATRDFSGRLREADGGTLFLDEVGELPLDVQVKLLRFVQDKEFSAVGATDYQTVDTRIVAATNRELKAMVAAGQFREDLFYRLNVFEVELPPLRDRPEDIMLLARHYAVGFAQAYNKPLPRFSAPAESVLQSHRWPGNVRELINVINHAVIVCRDREISPIHLGLYESSSVRELEDEAETQVISAESTEEVGVDGWLGDHLDSAVAAGFVPLAQRLEEDLIDYCLQLHAGVVGRAAVTLGMPESTLRRKVSQRSEAVDQHPASWVGIQAVFEDFEAAARGRDLSLVDFLHQRLVTLIDERSISRGEGARLMGVSLPTYRRMLQS